MKHVAVVSKASVARGGAWEDFVCVVTRTLDAFISFFGGSSPLLSYVVDKCDISPPDISQ